MAFKRFALIGSLLSTSYIALASPTSLDPVRQVYEFPNDTWVENIAVRSNGQLLVTILSTPQLFLIDPSAPSPSDPILVHDFAGYLDVFGIAEYDTDKFAVVTGNLSLQTGALGIGSWAAWSVDLNGVELSLHRDGRKALSQPPKVAKIADLPSAHSLNGLTLLSQKQQTLLVGDINTGTISRLDIKTGNFEVVLNDTFTAVAPAPPFGSAGIDGLHVRNGNELFFANFGKGQLNKVLIHEDGTPAGPVTTVAHTLAPEDQFDDFTFDCAGNIFLVTGGGDSIEMVSTNGVRQTIIAGKANSTLIAEPTSCAFGRGPNDKNVLYVVTSGGLAKPVDGDEIVGGQVVAVRTTSIGSAC